MDCKVVIVIYFFFTCCYQRPILKSPSALQTLSYIYLYLHWQGATAYPSEEEEDDDENDEEDDLRVVTLPLQAHHAMEKMEEFVHKVSKYKSIIIIQKPEHHFCLHVVMLYKFPKDTLSLWRKKVNLPTQRDSVALLGHIT